MKMPQLLILLLTILVHVGDGFPTERQRRDKHASWDDVNVVAHGLLQLGQGLKEHVDKTKAHMRDVNSKLKAFNNTVAELEKKQQEQDEALRARRAGGEGEQERYRLLTEQAEEVKLKVGEVKKQTEDITSRMDRLEEVLTEPIQDGNDSEHKTVSFIQRLMISQNRRIDQLVEKIQQQQDKLEKQSLHLQALQTKIAHKRVKSHRRRDEEMALTGEAEPIQRESGLAQDCHDLFMRGQKASGVYTIQPEGSQAFSVLCQMTPEGGWTIIQKRQDGSQNFNQLWESYKNGFGSLNGEMKLLLKKIVVAFVWSQKNNLRIFFIYQESSGWDWITSTPFPSKASTSCRWSCLMRRGSSEKLVTNSSWMARRRCLLCTSSRNLPLEFRRTL
uniref:Angiopoietin-like 4 n=1 Tax=Nothobranchius rachovii TaxID=451742 RepID=A0A1A8S8V9_9TELE